VLKFLIIQVGVQWPLLLLPSGWFTVRVPCVGRISAPCRSQGGARARPSSRVKPDQILKQADERASNVENPQ
jgi:hypothetical protein